MNYDSFASTFSRSRKNLSWPELDAIIEDIKSREYMTVLDIGCGNGRFLEEAKKRGYTPTHYLGTDNSEGMIREAQNLHPDSRFEVIPMESHSSQRISEKYDAIVFLASFHHLMAREDRLTTLHQVQSILSPSGRIYMTNWNLRDQEKYDIMRISEGEYQIKIGSYTRYYHGFTLSELESLFRETGYTIVKNSIFEGERNFLSILSHG